MALDATTASQYYRLALQQQQLYSFWSVDGDSARAYLALNLANWYYQQLGLAIYEPANDPGYTPNPASPADAAAMLASLPLSTADTFGGAASDASAAASSSAANTDDLTRGFGAPIVAGGTGDDSAALQAKAISALSSGYQLNGSLADYCTLYPDDPICFDGDPFDTFNNSGDGTTTIVNITQTVTVNQDGLTIGTVASTIAGALGNLANAIGSAVDAGLAAVVSGVQSALNAIGNALVSVWQFLSRLIGQILKFLQGLLVDVIHGLVAAVNEIGKLLKDVIQNVLMPALHALQELRDYLVKIYQRFLRPLLIWLQDARKVLAILKAFHIGFATKLDNALADIQAKISAPLLYLMSWTNTIANYINLILDARLLFQRPLWLASFNAYAGSSLTLQLNAMTKAPDPADLAALQAAATPPDPATSAASLNQFLDDGTGPYAAPIAQNADLLNQILTQGLS